MPSAKKRLSFCRIRPVVPSKLDFSCVYIYIMYVCQFNDFLVSFFLCQACAAKDSFSLKKLRRSWAVQMTTRHSWSALIFTAVELLNGMIYKLWYVLYHFFQLFHTWGHVEPIFRHMLIICKLYTSIACLVNYILCYNLVFDFSSI